MLLYIMFYPIFSSTADPNTYVCVNSVGDLDVDDAGPYTCSALIGTDTTPVESSDAVTLVVFCKFNFHRLRIHR